MPINKLGHFSVRTTALKASRRFYCDVLGLREGYRPPFNFPGVWLYRGDDESDYGVVHLIGIDRSDTTGPNDYLGDKDENSLHGSATVDHLAFSRDRSARHAAALSHPRRRVPRANSPQPGIAPGVRRGSFRSDDRTEFPRDGST